MNVDVRTDLATLDERFAVVLITVHKEIQIGDAFVDTFGGQVHSLRYFRRDDPLQAFGWRQMLLRHTVVQNDSIIYVIQDFLQQQNRSDTFGC